MGLPHKDCVWLARALTQMQYNIVTTHGPTQTVSTTDHNTTLFGIGQGATDAPAGWLLISAILSTLYDALNKGITLTSPDKN